MTKQYIIKNCPAFDDQGRCFQGSVLLGTAFKECEEKDCLIKQVIEKCTVALEVFDKYKDENLYAQGRCATAENILQLFEIEEVNND